MTSYEMSGPHISTPNTIEKTMWSVALALLPVAAAAVIFFGPYSLYLVFVTALFSVLLDLPFTDQKFPTDGSAFVTGMLLGLSLPPSSPYWLPLLGAFFAIVVAKHCFGGLGNNIFNPALAGRAVLRLSFASYFYDWRTPFSGVTTATPLADLASYSPGVFFSGQGSGELWNLFIGNIPGTVGETSAFAILIGALFLYWKGHLEWRIPVSYIGSVIVLSLLLGIDPLFSVFSGALMLGACFMATDMVTSPAAKNARLAFGSGCGILTMLIRYFGYFDGGVTFAILAMNAVSYQLDYLLDGPHYGQITQWKKSYYYIAATLGAVGLFLLLSRLAIMLGG